MTVRPRKEKSQRAMIFGSQGESWVDPLSESGFKTRLSSEESLETDIHDYCPDIILIHEKPEKCTDIVIKIRLISFAKRIPVLVVTAQDEKYPAQKYGIPEAGADEVVFETQSIEVVIETVRVLLETVFPLLGENKEVDPVARALDAAKTLGMKSHDREEERPQRLDLSSSIASAIDVAQKKYVCEIMGGLGERTELRRKRADSAILLFCQMIEIEPGASLMEIKSQVTRLIGDLEYLEKESEEALALRTAAHAILRLEE